MAVWHGQSKRSNSGRRIRYARGKRKFEIGREKNLTTIGDNRKKKVRTRGCNQKIRLKTTNIAYVLDKKTKKITKSNIVTVRENAANIHYVRRNILNKGAIIETDIGKAKITSRPGQNGVINAVLI
jgi:small subunit ribosomal protein S8e